jgi:group I intron endonuclease
MITNGFVDTGVYQIRNLINGKVYIGSAANSFKQRWRSHKHKLRTNLHHSKKLQHAWNKYGEHSFVFEVLITCSPSQCVAIEQSFLDKTNAVASGYNICSVAGSRIGVKSSADTIAKLSALNMGKTVSEETRAKISACLKGRRHSEETRAKISNAKLGKKVSDETRAKISATLLGRTVDDKVREKISKTSTGRKCSKETCLRMSASKQGHFVSDEARAKMSESAKRRISNAKISKQITE